MTGWQYSQLGARPRFVAWQKRPLPVPLTTELKLFVPPNFARLTKTLPCGSRWSSRLHLLACHPLFPWTPSDSCALNHHLSRLFIQSCTPVEQKRLLSTSVSQAVRLHSGCEGLHDLLQAQM